MMRQRRRARSTVDTCDLRLFLAITAVLALLMFWPELWR